MLRIAVAAPNRDKYSETFIKAQIEGLQGEVHFLHGGYLPTHFGLKDATPLVPNSFRYQLRDLFYREILKKDVRSFLENGIAEYLVRHKIDVVLAQYGPTGVELAPICRRIGLPLVVYFHGYDAFRADMMASHGGRYLDLFQTAAEILVVSEPMRQRLIDLGAAPEKITLNSCGADIKRFAFADAGRNPPLFFASGRFAETKSPHLTLLAFEKALRQCPEVELRMAGDGHLLEACQLLARALRLENKVQFLGALPQAEVARQMQGARAFVQHSVITPSGDSEGTPVAIQEAGAVGLPVVATRNAGIPAVVLHEETGLLVAEGDIDGMAAALVRLATFPEDAARMGAAAQRRILENFTLAHTLQRLQAVLERAATRNIIVK